MNNFYYIPHDLLISKLDAYGFNRNVVRYVYSYLEKGKQCARINSATNSFKHILSGSPQRSMLGPTLLVVDYRVT